MLACSATRGAPFLPRLLQRNQVQLHVEGGLSDEVVAALGKSLEQYDEVQAALNNFDSLSMSEEATFQMNLGLPMGLRLDDDTLVT